MKVELKGNVPSLPLRRSKRFVTTSFLPYKSRSWEKKMWQSPTRSLRSEAMMIPYIWKMNCWDASDCKCRWVRCIVNVLRWNPLGNWMKSYAWRFYLCFLNSSVISNLFALASIRIFSLALFYITFYIYSPWEVLKRMWYGLEFSGSRFLFTENKNKKLLTFLMGFVLKFLCSFLLVFFRFFFIYTAFKDHETEILS